MSGLRLLDLSSGVLRFNQTFGAFEQNALWEIPASLWDSIAGGTNETDLTTYLQAGLDRVGARQYGGTFLLPPGKYLTQRLLQPNNVLFKATGGGRSVIQASPSIPLGGFTSAVLSEQEIDTGSGARDAVNLGLEGIEFDCSLRPYERWLSDRFNPATAITDPENDYHNSVYAFGSASGVIGNPAYAADDDAVAVAQGLTNGVPVTLATPTVAYPRRLTATATGADVGLICDVVKILNGVQSATTITLVNGTTPVPTAIATFSTLATTSEALIFDEIVSITPRSTSSGNVSFGIAAADIDSLVADGRRNPDHNYLGGAIWYRKVDRLRIRNVIVDGEGGTGITTAGCRDYVIEQCLVKNGGRPDGPNFGIYCASYGNPASPIAGYADDDDGNVINNIVRDWERIGLVLSMTTGGEARGNRLYSVREAGIYATDECNYNGGRTRLIGNRVKGVTASDIVGKGIDVAGGRSYDLIGNLIENTDYEGIDATDVTGLRAKYNTWKDCGLNTLGTTPFGPFGERWSHNRGQAVTAGGSPSANRLCYVRFGNTSSVIDPDNVVIEGNGFDDTGIGQANAIFYPLHQASGNALYHRIAKNHLSSGAQLLPFLNTDANPWTSACPLEITGNRGHVSQGSVPIQVTLDTPTGTAQSGSATTMVLAVGSLQADDYYNGWKITITSGTGVSATEVTITDYVASTNTITVASWPAGSPDNTSVYRIRRTTYTFSPGFRPGSIDVMAFANSTLLRHWVGKTVWKYDQGTFANQAVGQRISTNFTTTRVGQQTNIFAYVTNHDNSIADFSSALSSWLPTGFSISISTQITGVTIEVICHPPH